MKSKVLILLILTVIFGCKSVQYGRLKFTNVREYKDFLIDEGYSIRASKIISETEFKIIPISAEYIELIED
jgi:hypothetical protein